MARQLADILDAEEFAGETIGACSQLIMTTSKCILANTTIHCFLLLAILCEIECYVKPLQACNELRNTYGKVSVARGDVGEVFSLVNVQST